MKKTLDQKIAAAALALAGLEKERRTLEKGEAAKRRMSLGARIELAGGAWLAEIDDERLKTNIERLKRMLDRSTVEAGNGQQG